MLSVTIIDDLEAWTRQDGFFHFGAVEIKRVNLGLMVFTDIVTVRDPVFHRDDWPRHRYGEGGDRFLDSARIRTEVEV